VVANVRLFDVTQWINSKTILFDFCIHWRHCCDDLVFDKLGKVPTPSMKQSQPEWSRCTEILPEDTTEEDLWVCRSIICNTLTIFHHANLSRKALIEVNVDGSAMYFAATLCLGEHLSALGNSSTEWPHPDSRGPACLATTRTWPCAKMFDD